MLFNHLKEVFYSDFELDRNQETRLGGSEIASVLGLNPYCSNIELFYRKIGVLGPIEKNEAMFFGQVFEDKIAELWEYFDGSFDGLMTNFQTQNIIRECENIPTLFNPNFPEFIASPDRIILPSQFNGKHGVLEIKTANKWVLDKFQDGIPPYYLAQLQLYLMVTELDYGEVCILADGRDFQVHGFRRDDEMIRDIYNKGRAFKLKCDEAREVVNSDDLTEAEKKATIAHLLPEADDSQSLETFLKGHFEADNELSVSDEDTLKDLYAYARNYQYFKRREEEVKQAKTQYSNQIRMTLKEATLADFGDSGKISYKANRNGIRTLRIKVND